MIRKNILKRNIKRYSAGFIFALSLFSLVGVGFSSWITSKNDNKNIGFNVNGDDVDLQSDYFIFNEDESTINNNLTKRPVYFAYNDYGIVENDTIISYAKFSFFLTCILRSNSENIKGIYDESESINKFTIGLEIVDNGAFNISQYFLINDNSNAYYVLNSNSTNKLATSSKVDRTISITASCDDQAILNQTYIFYRFDLIFDLSSYQNYNSQELNNINLSISVASYYRT